MTLTEIKTSISNLSPEEQAELDLWWTEQELVAQRRAAFESLRRDLIESYEDMESGRTRPWTPETIGEIKEAARKTMSDG